MGWRKDKSMMISWRTYIMLKRENDQCNVIFIYILQKMTGFYSLFFFNLLDSWNLLENKINKFQFWYPTNMIVYIFKDKQIINF